MTNEETRKILLRLKESRPVKLSEHFDKERHGIICLLRFLSESEHPVTAGDISNHMNVSTARVAVLLKKMEKSGLIEKSSDPSDARKTMVGISEEGRKMIAEKEEQFLEFWSAVIEKCGRERFMEFVQISEEIKTAFEDELQVVERRKKEEMDND